VKISSRLHISFIVFSLLKEEQVFLLFQDDGGEDENDLVKLGDDDVDDGDGGDDGEYGDGGDDGNSHDDVNDNVIMLKTMSLKIRFLPALQQLRVFSLVQSSSNSS